MVNILENRLGIDTEADLAREEERITKRKAVELLTGGSLETMEAGTFRTLQYIHWYLFSDVYPFAGKIRKVDISKGSTFFAPLRFLDQSLQAVEEMPLETVDQIIEKYVEMNIVHPFRDGNGRSMRIWLKHMLEKKTGMVVDWSKISREDYLSAMERSPIKDIEIKHYLKNALTEPGNDREFLRRNIDTSYYYEGYNQFSTDEL